MNQKDIILMPYPFTDLKERKVRPALIISNDKFNNSQDDVIAVPLTTIIKDVPYSLLIGQKDLISGDLIKPSRIRADKIFSVEKKLIITKVGTIDNKTFEKVKSELLKLL